MAVCRYGEGIVVADSSRLRVLALYRILFRETDDEHPLNAEELCARLTEQKIAAERKTVYRDLAALRDYGADILFTRKPSPGFFMAGRDFELPEVRLLMDAVEAASFITEKKTEELLEKLRSLLSRYQGGVCGEIYAGKRVKFDNEEIYYNIDAVQKAVAANRRLSFVYYHSVIEGNRISRDGGREFTLSPYALLWDSDRYYLVGNYEKYNSVSHYRLDRMKHVQVLTKPARPFEEVCDYRGRFDADDYAKKTFHMYHGERKTVELRCADSVLENVLDKFGEDPELLAHGGGAFTVRANVYVGEGFLEWLLQYGGRIEVLSPESLRRDMTEKIRELAEAYSIKTCDP